MLHVLRHHVDEKQVPHGCKLCGYKCDTLALLKGHRKRYSPHKTALNRAAANGKRVNEDQMEYHSKNPVSIEELIEVTDYDSIGE